MNEPKLALAMIVKGDDEEAKVLQRCLANSAQYVDGIFITITQPNERVRKVAENFGARISEFEWVGDFAKARNFNFNQVGPDFTHIVWLDADDVPRGFETLKDTLREHPEVDGFVMFYLYSFNEYGDCVTAHLKTRVIKNNHKLKWVGHVHEDLMGGDANIQMLEGSEVLHLTDEKRMEGSGERNLEIAVRDADEAQPRSYWNLANAYVGVKDYDKAAGAFMTFMKLSGSEEERYLAHLRLSDCFEAGGRLYDALEQARHAIGLRPHYPDAYFRTAKVFMGMQKYSDAIKLLFEGLSKRVPYYEIIVFNPRDYDFNPLLDLAHCYMFTGRAEEASIALEKCLEIQPKSEPIRGMLKKIKGAVKDQKEVEAAIEKLKPLEDNPEELGKAIDKLPKNVREHNLMRYFRNKNVIKAESSGKDIVYYCGYTQFEWNPDVLAQKGLGGSEEAVINLAKYWASKGYNVTVYNNCGDEKVYDGVTYKPYWMWNYRDKQDVTILWRSTKELQYDINSKVCIDLHDVPNPLMFTEENLKRVHKIFVKTKFHQSFLPDVPEDKFAIVPNGQDFDLFDQKVEKDQYLAVNTSSPDRSLQALVELWPEIKKQVPEAKCEWAYGWEVFDIGYGDNPRMMAWKDEIRAKMKELGIVERGRVTQKEAVEMYLRGNVLAYPSEFAEIDCITVKKAQAAGCMPITTDFGAFQESIKYGVKIPSKKTKDTWCVDNQFEFGIKDPKQKKQWVDAVVEVLKTPIGDRSEMKAWTTKFSWDKIADQWLPHF